MVLSFSIGIPLQHFSMNSIFITKMEAAAAAAGAAPYLMGHHSKPVTTYHVGKSVVDEVRRQRSSIDPIFAADLLAPGPRRSAVSTIHHKVHKVQTERQVLGIQDPSGGGDPPHQQPLVPPRVDARLIHTNSYRHTYQKMPTTPAGILAYQVWMPASLIREHRV